MTVNRGPDPSKTLDAVSHQYYEALVFHANHEIELPELWMLGLDPVALNDRALTAERFDPIPCDEDMRRIGVCPCVTCKRKAK